MKFNYAMNLKELKMRTSKKCYKGIKFLNTNSKELRKLSDDDLMVLCHLTRAAKKLEKVNLKLDNHKNLEFLNFLNEQISKNDKKAILTKKLFLSQKSIFSPDALGNQTILTNDVGQSLGLGYFPDDLTACEFHKILNDMIDGGDVDEVRKILNQRTIVVKYNNKLKAIDFVEAFPEFREIADELEKAKSFSSDKKFNKFLEYQILALTNVNSKYDAKADKVWAELDRSKFEFTIARECYDEGLTKSIYENKDLLEKIQQNGITIYAKDSLGARVGIVNKRGTKLLKKLKDLILVAAKFMPFQDEYDCLIEQDNTKQKAVDVDLVTLTGAEGAYRAGIVLAQNLPNDDKLSLLIGGGRRNVYHRQIRQTSNKKLYKNLICEEQYKYFKPDANHWAVICHENTHSLGPKTHNELGKYSLILEEFKADMGMYAFLKEFENEGFFSNEQVKEIVVSSLGSDFLKGKPNLNQEHRVRSVMILNRMMKEKAIKLNDDLKLVFDFDKVIETSKKMMSEVVRLQLDKDVKKAERYVLDWFVWTTEMEKIAETIKKYSHTLNGYVIEPLADAFMNPDFKPSEIIR